MDGDIGPLFDRQTPFAHFAHESVLMHFPGNPAPSVFETTNAHPVIFRERSVWTVLSAFICVHLWFHCFTATKQRMQHKAGLKPQINTNGHG